MKSFTVRYHIKDNPVITKVSSISQFRKLVSGEAKNSIIEVKISEKMSVSMHNLIADHNANFEKKEVHRDGGTKV